MGKITDELKALPRDGSYVSLEFFPPKTQMGFSNLQARLERMSRALRPLFVNVTCGAGGSTADKSLELAGICQRQLGLTTCLHLTCTNMSCKLVDRTLDEAKALGVRNILALRGDPPRHEEYRREDEDCSDWSFTWAVDLVRYIRKRHGDYFCIGVAAYPDGHWDMEHPAEQSRKFDLPYLVEKVQAGADFIMTQLFFDVGSWRSLVDELRSHPSGALKEIPIIPGLMPVQSYQILNRTTKLTHVSVPKETQQRLDAVKGDDEAVKRVGIDVLCEMISTMRGLGSHGPHVFHFYTLNLEKVVTQILERSGLLPPMDWNGETNGHATVAIGDGAPSDTLQAPAAAERKRRLSSRSNETPHNRVIVDRTRSPGPPTDFEALDDEAGVPKEKSTSRANTVAISTGKGALGREATWDDYPNGRWGNARSPAYGEIDGYGTSLHISVYQAARLWGSPTSTDDVSKVFRRYITGELASIPWSEDTLNDETITIRDQLLRLNAKSWWTIASQPAVNGVKSTDPVFGWGPASGFVFQKPFVELFLPAADWRALRARLDTHDDVTYFAADRSGAFEASDPDSVDPVTWGTFRGQEIVTPTIIEAVNFRAWAEEAFGLWTEWMRVYPPNGESAKLLRTIRDGYWLVNVIHHDFIGPDALWNLLLVE